MLLRRLVRMFEVVGNVLYSPVPAGVPAPIHWACLSFSEVAGKGQCGGSEGALLFEGASRELIKEQVVVWLC